MIEQEPELRHGPPWIMDEMINEQLDLPAQVAESGTELLRTHIAHAEVEELPITFCGCGTSEHAAKAAAAVLRAAKSNLEISARDAFEVRLDPPTRGLLVAVSHSGETSATLEAAQNALRSGAHSLLMTAVPELAPEGVTAVPTPVYDRSWCHTVAYTSPILTTALASGTSPASARSTIERELSARSERVEDARKLLSCDRFLIVGSGGDEITAAELALKLEEAIHVPSTPFGVEKVLHGHLPAATAHSGLILLRYEVSANNQRDQRAHDVDAACAVLGMPRVKLRSPVQTVAESLLAGAVAAQLLTVALATELGINPDLIRREEDLYRKVAEVAKAG